MQPVQPQAYLRGEVTSKRSWMMPYYAKPYANKNNSSTQEVEMSIYETLIRG
jgi:hypothetical protein